MHESLQVGAPTLITKYLQMVRNSNKKSLKLLDNMHESLPQNQSFSHKLKLKIKKYIFKYNFSVAISNFMPREGLLDI